MRTICLRGGAARGSEAATTKPAKNPAQSPQPLTSVLPDRPPAPPRPSPGPKAVPGPPQARRNRRLSGVGRVFPGSGRAFRGPGASISARVAIGERIVYSLNPKHPRVPAVKRSPQAPPAPATMKLTPKMDLSNVDLKKTVNLPKTDFPMKANLPQTEPKIVERWEKRGSLRPDSRRPRRPAHLRPARRPALRQRQHPPGHRLQQDPQGLHRQVARPWRASTRPTSPAGIATACPSNSRSTANSAAKRRSMSAARDPRRVPQVRRKVRRSPAQRFQAPRRPRPLGRSVPHHERRSTKPSSPARSSISSTAATSTKA